MIKKDEPLLIFTTKVSRCANGYHLKIRKKDVELLNLAGKMVKIKVYKVDIVDEVINVDGRRLPQRA